MTKIDILTLKLVVPDDYQQFWVHFEWFLVLFIFLMKNGYCHSLSKMYAKMVLFGLNSTQCRFQRPQLVGLIHSRKQLMVPVGDAGEKFPYFFYQNELKSPKKQHVFFVFLHTGGGVGGWVRSKCVNLHRFFLNPSLTLKVGAAI